MTEADATKVGYREAKRWGVTPEQIVWGLPQHESKVILVTDDRRGHRQQPRGKGSLASHPNVPRVEAMAAATRMEGEHIDGIIGLIISLISGVVGGNIAGAALKEQSLGPIGNSIAGLIGGGLGGQILSALGVLGGTAVAGAGAQAGGFDLGSLIGNVAGSGVGGAILMIIVGFIKQAIAK